MQAAPPPSVGPRSESTDKDGVATFQWQPALAPEGSVVCTYRDTRIDPPVPPEPPIPPIPPTPPTPPEPPPP